MIHEYHSRGSNPIIKLTALTRHKNNRQDMKDLTTKQVVSACIDKRKIHPSIKVDVDYNYCEIFLENNRLYLRQWGAKDDEKALDITPEKKQTVIGYQFDFWNMTRIHIPTSDPMTGLGLLPFHPYLFGNDNPCIYSDAELGEINPLLNVLFDITIKPIPKMAVQVKAKRTVQGRIESWNSKHQRDSLGGYQQNSSYVLEEPILEAGTVINISELKNYGICFTNDVCPHHKLPFSKADYTPLSDDFEFIVEEDLVKYDSKRMAEYILENAQSRITSSNYGIDSSYGRSAGVKLPLLIGKVQF